MERQKFDYKIDGKIFCGEFVFDASKSQKRPGILVVHTWKGRDHFTREKSEELAKLGYIAFAADLYGEGVEASSNEEASELMTPLFKDRRLLRKRITESYKALTGHPLVVKEKTGAIGFCFGGLACIELLRSGEPLSAIATFHAVIGDTLHGMKAKLEPNAEKLKAAMLLLHGHEDPLVTAKDLSSFEDELTKAKVDWQFNIYGHTVHAFTNPQANDEALRYSEKASQRAWLAMKNFFEEHFQ